MSCTAAAIIQFLCCARRLQDWQVAKQQAAALKQRKASKGGQRDMATLNVEVNPELQSLRANSASPRFPDSSQTMIYLTSGQILPD